MSYYIDIHLIVCLWLFLVGLQVKKRIQPLVGRLRFFISHITETMLKQMHDNNKAI